MKKKLFSTATVIAISVSIFGAYTSFKSSNNKHIDYLILGENIALAQSESSTSDSKKTKGIETRDEKTENEEREVEVTTYYKYDAKGNIFFVTAGTEGAQTKTEKVKKTVPVKYWCTNCPSGEPDCVSTQWKEVE